MGLRREPVLARDAEADVQLDYGRVVDPEVKQTLLLPAPLVRNRLHTRNPAMFRFGVGSDKG
jgi:hypothetical protein